MTGKNGDNWFDIWKLGRSSEVYTFDTDSDTLISYTSTSESVIRYQARHNYAIEAHGTNSEGTIPGSESSTTFLYRLSFPSTPTCSFLYLYITLYTFLDLFFFFFSFLVTHSYT